MDPISHSKGSPCISGLVVLWNYFPELFVIFVFILNSWFPFPLRVMVNRDTVNHLLKVVLRL